MAENKIPFEVEVKGVEQSIESVKDLKAAIKAAKDEQLKAAAAFGEGSKEFIEASKNVSKLKDKVEDLADATKSLKGSGVERASEGFNQLGEGLKNLDFDKVKVGLIAMKSALAAVGIGLIVQLVSYLIENFAELSQGTGLLAKVLQGVGSVITYVKDEINKFTDALGLTNTELDKIGETLVKNADKAKESLAGQTAEYDRQIAIAKASGKSAVDLEIAKQEAIIATNKALIEQTISYVRSGGILSEEQKKLLTSQLEAIKTAVTTETVITLTAAKEKNDKLKALNDEAAKHRVDEGARFIAQITLDNDAEYNAEVAQLSKLEAIKLAANEKELSDKQALDAAKLNSSAIQGQEELDLDKANKAQKSSDEKAAFNGTVQLAQESLAATQQLTDLFFDYKRKGLQKGSKEEIKAAENQFKVNKALQIANAVVSGIQGVMAAYSSGSAIPIIGAVAGPAFAILAGVAAAANIAKIAAAKFNPGGGGAAPSVGGGAAPTAPSIPSPPGFPTAENNTNKTTSFDESGKRLGGDAKKETPTINVVATVGVSEIESKGNRVKVLENQSTF